MVTRCVVGGVANGGVAAHRVGGVVGGRSGDQWDRRAGWLCGSVGTASVSRGGVAGAGGGAPRAPGYPTVVESLRTPGTWSSKEGWAAPPGPFPPPPPCALFSVHGAAPVPCGENAQSRHACIVYLHTHVPISCWARCHQPAQSCCGGCGAPAGSDLAVLYNTWARASGVAAWEVDSRA